MSALLLARIRAVLVTGVVGGAVAHVALPYGHAASPARRLAFSLLMLLLGGGFGLLDARHRGRRGGSALLQASGIGALALVLAVVSYRLLHG